MFWFESKNHLEVKHNELFISGFNATELAEKYGTPLYVYNAAKISENFNELKKLFEKNWKREFSIHYAMKANSHLRILKLLHDEGAKVDATSPGEVEIAIRAGYSPKEIIFTGTSVSNADLKRVMDSNVLINADSFSQMRRMKELGYRGRFSLRWNPGEGAGHHEHVITAGKFIKFGVPESKILQAYREAKELGLKITGLHQHIGSGWMGKDVDVVLKSVDKTIALAKKIELMFDEKLEFIDFGGGPGIPYCDKDKIFPIEKYIKGICSKMEKAKMKCEIKIEPGRYIVGNAGILLAEVNTVEEKNVPIVGVNAGFNTLIRPAFYGSYHEIISCSQVKSKNSKKVLICGNVCESGDVFNTSKHELRELPIVKEGDIIALLNAGAYSYSMSSNYNSRPRPAEVLLLNGEDKLITEKEKVEDLVRLQKI